MSKLCGEMGHKTKTGQPCGYRIAENAEACPHHSPNPWAREFQKKGLQLCRTKRLPEGIDVENLETVDDLLALYARVARSADKQKDVDHKRLDIIIRALNGANQVLQTKAMKELYEVALQLQGHGQSLLVLAQLKNGPSRPLPGVRAMLEGEKSA